MKKIFLSLICLLSIAATGFSQQKGNKFTASQTQSVFRNQDKLSLDPGAKLETNLLLQQSMVNTMFNSSNTAVIVDCNLLCIPAKLFIDRIINQLFKDQY